MLTQADCEAFGVVADKIEAARDLAIELELRRSCGTLSVDESAGYASGVNHRLRGLPMKKSTPRDDHDVGFRRGWKTVDEMVTK